MKRWNFVLSGAALLLLISVFSKAQLKPPPIGIARLSDASVRTLYGLPENLIVDSRSFGSFDAASFSDQAGLLATHGRIQLVNTNFAVLGECETGEPQPLLNVDGSVASAIAWLPASQSLLFWNGTAFVRKEVTGIDRSLQATSVRVQNADTAQLLLTDTNGAVFEASVSLESGNLLSLNSLPGIHGTAFWQGPVILFQDANGLEVTTSNGAMQTIAIPAQDLTFDHVSSTWTLLTSHSASRTWALHVSGNDIHLSEVPAVAMKAQEAAK